MQRSQIIYDGLWHCLCPALDGYLLSRATPNQSLGLLRRQPVRPLSTISRRVHAIAGLSQQHQYTSYASSHTEEPWGPSTSNTRKSQDATQPSNGSWEQKLLATTPPSEETLKASSIDDVISALMALRDIRRWTNDGRGIDRHARIIQCIQRLMAVEEQSASPFIYECLADAMADPQGSVSGVRRLLDDMSSQGIKPTATFCQSALGALANHPDYVLRQEILGIMQEYWFTIDIQAKQSLVLGLLRDEQYELAYTRLTDMIEQGARVDPWVYDIFILVFGKLGFLDEMLQLLYRRKDGQAGTNSIMTNLLYHTLDVCSQAYHHAGTVFAWNSLVRNSVMQPSDGIIENVMGTAARNCDAQLASEALDLISSRTRAQAHHYETVVEAFAGSGDMMAAFRIMCIMKQNGVRVTRANTRTIYKAMKRRMALIEEAENAVRNMHREHSVPQAVISVIIETKAEAHGSEAALALYRDAGVLCGETRPKARTLQDLIIHSRTPATSQALVREYSEQFSEGDDPARSHATYSALISTCVEAGELDLGFRFAKRALALGGNAKRQLKWLRPLIEQAIAKEDGRIWTVVDEFSKCSDAETTKLVHRLLQQKRMAKAAANLKETA